MPGTRGGTDAQNRPRMSYVRYFARAVSVGGESKNGKSGNSTSTVSRTVVFRDPINNRDSLLDCANDIAAYFGVQTWISIRPFGCRPVRASSRAYNLWRLPKFEPGEEIELRIKPAKMQKAPNSKTEF